MFDLIYAPRIILILYIIQFYELSYSSRKDIDGEIFGILIRMWILL
jgi:hypothetical protein